MWHDLLPTELAPQNNPCHIGLIVMGMWYICNQWKKSYIGLGQVRSWKHTFFSWAFWNNYEQYWMFFQNFTQDSFENVIFFLLLYMIRVSVWLRICISEILKLHIPSWPFSATRETVSLCQRMAEAGAKALLIVTPCFYKGMMTNEALISHYTKVGKDLGFF